MYIHVHILYILYCIYMLTYHSHTYMYNMYITLYMYMYKTTCMSIIKNMG